MEDEGSFYLKVVNPCLINNGLAVQTKAIPDIEYWIKDAKKTEHVTKFLDLPTNAHYSGQSQANYATSGVAHFS